MKRVIVAGGGFAGLSTSVFLAEKNFEVTLIEASPKLGGRAYSLYNETFNDYYDNGQHILMGCYEETFAFLKKINSLDKLYFQDSLSISFVQRNGKIHRLKAAKNGYPVNLLFAILNYKALSLKERFKIIDFFLDLLCCSADDLKDKTVKEWLDSKKQSENSVKAFWEILVVGALNTTIDKASAEIFREILSEVFLNGNKSAAIVFPKVGLTELYVNDAVRFINARNGKVNLSEKVEQVEIHENKVVKLVTDKNSYSDFDFIVFAIPPYALSKIENLSAGIPTFKYSSILNVHLWLKENPFQEKFYGLIASKIHWLFNHGNHISLTTSAADDLIALESSEIVNQFCSELEIYFPIFHAEMVADSRVIKEKRATFIPDIASNYVRKNFNVHFENLIFAGDWVNTNLPSTIESAVFSGKLAAEKVISSLKK